MIFLCYFLFIKEKKVTRKWETMKKEKNTLWLDIAFTVVGIITLLLLFMPKYYTEYRVAGYVGAGIFVGFLIWRELSRRQEKKESGE